MPLTPKQNAWSNMQIYKSKKIWRPQANPGYAPVDM